MQIRGKHYATGQPIRVAVDAGEIAAVDPTDAPVESWIAPSFFDIQVNGWGGHAFSSMRLTVDGVHAIATECQRHGMGGFLPTFVTNSLETLVSGMSTVVRARDQSASLSELIPGFHLEGPWISPEDGPRGAHPAVHVRPPDWADFQKLRDASFGLIRLVTLAPEVPGAIPFIERLTKAGVVVALGHTDASASSIEEAVSAGARLSTHLGNGCRATMHRHQNPIWPQLADDRLWASVIADGHHLPDSIVQVILRVKSPARTILTSDLSSLAGLPPGVYSEWDQEIEVRADGRLVVPKTAYLAGSSRFIDSCVAHIVRSSAAGLGDAVEMASIRPRQLLGLPVPGLAPGNRADLFEFVWTAGGIEITSRCKTG
jgi:N-acetylglucosamine-6-phosphate deacetylase